MKLPRDSEIARVKVTQYLLKLRDEDDKSKFLAQAGYTLAQADKLLDDLRALLDGEAEFIQTTARIGRRYPGLVLVLHRMGVERDASVFRTFDIYIRQGDRFIEPIAITRPPFSCSSAAATPPPMPGSSAPTPARPFPAPPISAWNSC